MNNTVHSILVSEAPNATILIRLFVGFIFFTEGIQKFLFAPELGVGRFTKIGFPWPEFVGPAVGVFEVVCGLLLLLGFATRFAAIPLIVIMVGALLSTKLPILLGHDLLIFHVRDLARYGFWSMLHEARTDISLLFGSLFLLIVGSGAWSLDAFLIKRKGLPQ